VAGLIYFGFSAWLDVNSFHALAGDDVRSFTYARESFAAYNDFLVQNFRFRPVMVFLGRLCAQVTGGEFDQLRSIAFGVHTLNALLLYALLTRVVEVSRVAAGAIAVAATFTRFTNYLVMAETGVIESMGITIFLLFLWTLLSLLRTPRIATAWASAVLFALIIHIHERYLVLLGGMGIASLFLYRQNRRVSALLFFSGLGIAGGNILIKTVVLRTPVLTGTETQAITFSVGTKANFFFDGLLNLAGINRGPSYLSLLDFLESPGWLKTVSLLSAGFAIWLLGGALVAAVRSPVGHTARELLRSIHPQIAVLITLIVVLVLSASVTFRQEYRWLYPGYLAFLILLADSAKRWNAWRGSPAPFLVLSGFLLCGIPRELGIRTHRENFYQYSTCVTANALYELLSQSPHLKTGRAITIGGDEVPHSDWVFMSGMFSRYYGFPPLLFQSGAAGVENLSAVSLVRYDVRQNKFFENPRRTDGTPLPEYSSRVLANARLLSGNETNLSTPDGTRRVPFTLSGSEGWAMVAPVEFAVDRPEKAGFLYLSFSHIWKKAGAIQIEVFAVTNEGEAKLLGASVPPVQQDAVAEWQDYRIALPAGCHTLRVQLVPLGDQTSTWLMFRQFVWE